MKRGPRRRRERERSRSRSRRVWADLLWPVLLGAVIAVGLTGAVAAYGVTGALRGFALLAPFGLVVFWGLSDELGIGRATAVRLGLGSTLGVLVLLGLSELFPTYGLVFATGVALASPSAHRLLGRVRRRSRRRTVAATLTDRDLVDRRFHDIVSRLEDSGDIPES